MKKKTLAFLLSACLLVQSAGFVSASDFSDTSEETVNAEEIFSPEDDVTDSNPEPDQDSELLPEENTPEDIELEPEDSLTSNDSEDLLFDDGESDTFDDGSDSSSAAFASSETPDHDIWLADTVKNGLVVDGKTIQTKSIYTLITQASVKPVYQELGERILSNKPMLVLSSIWKGVIKQEFYDDQKLIYEALLADYLQFVDSTDSKGFDSSQIERANSYLIKMFNDLSTYYTQNGVYNWKPEDFMKLSAEEANKLLQSVDSMKTAVSLVGDTCSTTKELVELCTKVNAFKNAADERILLIQKARDAGSSNTAFVEACDAILAQLGSQSVDVSYLRSQSASAAMKKCTETMISELSKQNPALKALSYGSSAMDILFNTSSINSDNLKLSLLYTMDCYFNTALTSSSSAYTRYTNADNANAFVKCFQGYTTFQIYADNVAKSYISGVTSGGVLNRTFADIFYREGVENAESWKTLCDDQINIRRSLLDILAKFYQVYNRFYLKDEYTNALKDQITATPTPTPKPLVPVDYEVTVPESKNPVKSASTSASVKWTLFEDGSLFFYGEGIIKLEDYNYRYVTGSDAKYKQDIKKIFVSEGITEILYYSFSGFPNLTNVSLSDSVTRIGSNVFENCTSLQEITMSQKLEEISTSAFQNCKSLQTIALPETLLSIQADAFKGCNNLKKINFPEHLSRIGESAFEGCSSLESVTIPGSLNSPYSPPYAGYGYYYGLANNAFRNCTSLKTVTFKKGDALSCIGNNVFENCTSLKTVTFSDTIQCIGNNAFYKCTNLTEIKLPGKLQILGKEAFKNCTGLKKIVFPSNTSLAIKEFTFQNCTGLENISFTGFLGEGSFSGCTNLKKITLNAPSVPAQAFKNCKNLATITLSKNTYSIGDEAFSGCTCIKNISLPGNFGSLGQKSFYNCTSLQKIVLPRNICLLNNEEFAGCKNLKSITFLYDDGNMFSDKPGITKSAVRNCTNLKTIYGYNGLYLESTAENLGLKFVALDKAPSIVPSFSATPGKETIKVSWKKRSDVSGYEVQISNFKNFSDYMNYNSFSTKEASTTSYTGFLSGQTYYVRMRAYKTYVVRCYGKWSTPKAVTILPIKAPNASAPVLKSGKQYFRASWKKTSGTSGYQIQYSLYKNFKTPVTKTLTGSTKNNITVSKLKRNKRYYVRVRAYRNANSKKYYGKWSGTRSIVVK